MKTSHAPLYFCSECKQVVGDLGDLLFIDEFSQRGFCTEECIESFYLPLIEHFRKEEECLRESYELLAENETDSAVDLALINEALSGPSELFCQGNELGDVFYYFIKHHFAFSVVVVAALYQGGPSFVFLSVKSGHKKFIDEYRRGEVVENPFDLLRKTGRRQGEVHDDLPTSNEHGEGLELEEDFAFIQDLENKKSKILAHVLTKKSDDDIPFEEYPSYEFCFQDCLDLPDEVFERKDEEGDTLFTYIKSFAGNAQTVANFFYVILCLKRAHPESAEVSAYPILAFPTKDLKLWQEFRSGHRLTGLIKN